MYNLDYTTYDSLAYGMNLALDWARYSHDPSVQNGAVVKLKNGECFGGTNALSLGYWWADERNWVRPRKYSIVEHAERYVIHYAARHGYALEGTVMYCPWAACADCARAIVGSGIATLVRFPSNIDANGIWNESIEMGDWILDNGGVNVVELDMEDFKIPDGLRLGQFRKVDKCS